MTMGNQQFHSSSNPDKTCGESNIISNHDFSLGLQYWQPSCHGGQSVLLSDDTSTVNGLAAKTGTCYAIVNGRKEPWHGLEQDITGKVSPSSTYAVSAWVGVSGSKEAQIVQATLKLEYFTNRPTTYMGIGRIYVFNEQWKKLEGAFSLDTLPDRLTIYLEGPSPAIDLLVDSLILSSTEGANVVVEEEDCAMVTIGQIMIATGQVELYRRLISQFGEIVSPNLSKYSVEITGVALNTLLNAVEDMINITPETISEELVLDWEEMAEAYRDVGLKIDWFVDRVQRYHNWLDNCSEKNVILLIGEVVVKHKEVQHKFKDLQLIESELRGLCTEVQGLCTELETAQKSQSQFGFSFFDE